MFSSDTLQQKIEITDLKPFLAADNTSVLIIFATSVYYQYKNIQSEAFHLIDRKPVLLQYVCHIKSVNGESHRFG